MKRVSFLTTLASVAILTVPAFSLADAKAEISKSYDARLKLFKAKNATGMTKLFTELTTEDISMEGAGMSGMKKAEMAKMIKSQLSLVQSVKGGSMTLAKWNIKGNTVSVEATEKMEFTMANPQDPKKPMVMKGITISSDTWVKVGEKWKLKKVKVVKEEYTMNGKKMSEAG